MFGVSKKSAASLAELLVILAIIGVMSVMYNRTVDKDAILVNYAYKNLMNNVIGYAATVTDTYQNPFPNGTICNRFAETVNTLGDVNCGTSNSPFNPNLTTTSGIRFFGLDRNFVDYGDGTSWGDSGKMDAMSVFIEADLDGLAGDNRKGVDIFGFELFQNGRIRPTGNAVVVGGQNISKGNIARDPNLYSVTASYIPPGVTDRASFQNIGSRLSYAEAQCLSGNFFPYREDSSGSGHLQMCIEDEELRTAINRFRDDQNAANRIARNELIRTKRLEWAESGEICDAIYEEPTGVTYRWPKLTDDGVERCKKCWRAAYRDDYCVTEASKTAEDAAGNRICPDTILDANIGTCLTQKWAEPTR